MIDSKQNDFENTSRIKRWKKYIEISELGPIARRYFVMNAFDGALTMLGVTIGATMAHTSDPSVLIAAGISGSFAMGISGFSGAYMAESAERTKELKDIEKAMLKPMKDESLHKEAAAFATRVTAVVDAVSPALAALLVVSPYFLVNFDILTMSMAFYSSLALTFIVLAFLGVYLAKVTDENLLLHAVKMLGVGAVTVVLCVLISLALGTGTVI